MRYWRAMVLGGGHSLFNYCIHVPSRPFYRGAIYLVEKIIRYSIFFKIKVNACILILHRISYYKNLVESLKDTLFYLYCIVFLIP